MITLNNFMEEIQNDYQDLDLRLEYVLNHEKEFKMLYSQVEAVEIDGKLIFFIIDSPLTREFIGKDKGEFDFIEFTANLMIHAEILPKASEQPKKGLFSFFERTASKQKTTAKLHWLLCSSVGIHCLKYYISKINIEQSPYVHNVVKNILKNHLDVLHTSYQNLLRDHCYHLSIESDYFYLFLNPDEGKFVFRGKYILDINTHESFLAEYIIHDVLRKSEILLGEGVDYFFLNVPFYNLHNICQENQSFMSVDDIMEHCKTPYDSIQYLIEHEHDLALLLTKIQVVEIDNAFITVAIDCPIVRNFLSANLAVFFNQIVSQYLLHKEKFEHKLDWILGHPVILKYLYSGLEYDCFEDDDELHDIVVELLDIKEDIMIVNQNQLLGMDRYQAIEDIAKTGYYQIVVELDDERYLFYDGYILDNNLEECDEIRELIQDVFTDSQEIEVISMEEI